MQNATFSDHALVSTLARCLSGQWLIEPTWLLNNIDLIARAERSEDLSAVWPKPSLTYMVNRDGMFQAAAREGITGKGTALGLISIVGPIYKYGWYGSKNLINYLNALASDEQVGAIEIKIDSPGGQHAGTREVYELIRDFPKPVLIAVDGYMASAALYQGAGATKIVATQPTDQIGSLGTYSTQADMLGYWKSLGLNVYETYATLSTEKNEEFRQLIESEGKNRTLLTNYLDVLNNQFIGDMHAVRTNLNKAVEKGRIYFTQEAIEMGLIDDLVPDKDTLPLLADMQQATKQTTIQMGLKAQFLQMVNSMKDDESSSNEELTAQITQLTTERDAAKGQVTNLTNQVNTLTSERDGLKKQVTSLTTERDSLQEKVTAYGSQPGAFPTNVNKDKDDTPAAEGDTKTLQQKIAGFDSEKEAEEAGF